MTETAKVLHYPAKRGRAAVSAVERKIRKNKLLDELERLKIDVKMFLRRQDRYVLQRRKRKAEYQN